MKTRDGRAEEVFATLRNDKALQLPLVHFSGVLVRWDACEVAFIIVLCPLTNDGVETRHHIIVVLGFPTREVGLVRPFCRIILTIASLLHL